MFPVLETDRLLLREIKMEDSMDIFNCFSNENVTRYYGIEPLKNSKQAENYVELFSQSFLEKRGIRWGIQRRDAEGLIGTIGFNAWVPKHRRAEIGYELHPAHWRNGYAQEAITRVLNYGFNHMELSRIGAIVFIQNEPSTNLLLKIGFKKEGLLRNYMYQNGLSHDTNVFSIIPEEFVYLNGTTS